MIQILEYNPNLGPEIKDRILHANFEALRGGLNVQKRNLLTSLISKTAQTITSTSYVDITGLTCSFTTSGGLVEIDVKVAAFTNNDITAKFRLVLDGDTGNPKDMSIFGTNAGANIGDVVLRHEEYLLPGPHRIQVQGLVSGSDVGVSASDRWSRVKVTETID